MISDLEPALLCRFEQLALEYDSDDIGELDQLAGDQATRGLASTDQYSKLFDQFLDEHATKDHQFEGGQPYRVNENALESSTPQEQAEAEVARKAIAVVRCSPAFTAAHGRKGIQGLALSCSAGGPKSMQESSASVEFMHNLGQSAGADLCCHHTLVYRLRWFILGLIWPILDQLFHNRSCTLSPLSPSFMSDNLLVTFHRQRNTCKGCNNRRLSLEILLNKILTLMMMKTNERDGIARVCLLPVPHCTTTLKSWTRMPHKGQPCHH